MVSTPRRVIPAQFLLRTDNPGAKITSPGIGLPDGFHHRLENNGVLETLRRAHYQSAADAYADCGKHRRIYLGDQLHVVVNVDRFGQPGMVTKEAYTIRKPGCLRALAPSSKYPRHHSKDPCHLTELDISDEVLAAIEQGVRFSWSVVRPKFGNLVGDILAFWPSDVPICGAAALDLLGECVDLSTYTAQAPFDPVAIYVCIPWLSEKEFGGEYMILGGSGRKRLVIANGGWYFGGVKKPITFQLCDRSLPMNSPFVTQHWAITQLRSGRAVAIGATTAAGKTEGASDEADLPTPGLLQWTQDGGSTIDVHIGEKSAFRSDRASPRTTALQVVSDDISAAIVDPYGRIKGGEIECATFNRFDLCRRPGDIPIADDMANGKMGGRRAYFCNIGFDDGLQQFQPWVHPLLGDARTCTNPRGTYSTFSNSRVRQTSRNDLVDIDFLVLSVPVPTGMPDSFHYPTIVRVGLWDFVANCCSGLRANKGNPALGSIGNGFWAFEGWFGKDGFTYDSQAQMASRDLPFWRAVDPRTPCFLVFNGCSMGMTQQFKYSGTFLWRALIEAFGDQFLNAPLLPLPGVYSGGVPDISKIVPELDPKVWDPRVLDQVKLQHWARQLDLFVYAALNQILGQRGLNEADERTLADLMRRFSRNGRR